MRRGVSLFAMVLFIAAVAAAAARADGGSGTTTTGTTDTTTTATTTTTTTPTTTTTAEPTYAPLAASRLSRGCVGAGVAAIASPGGAPLTLSLPHAGLGPSEYPASRPFLTFDTATVTGSGCRNEHVTLTNVSFFGGAVTAATITATDGKGSVTGLEVGGSAVTAKRGQTVGVGSWGLVELGAANGRLSAPLALRFVYRHNAVPGGTTIYVGFAALRRQPHRAVATPVVPHHRPHHAKTPHVPQPLTWTPHLGFDPSHYVFPVDGGASYGDTYGANRNDIYDGWHHGDDLFAPLGTPVVAVATGKLSPLGWDGLGGWRLWLTDKKGNSFYYAHLAGYARSLLHDRHVKAGQVIGFLGRTGDAFTTTPHLHFEIHPHQHSLVSRGYDGAVDPTTYLDTWRVVHLPASAIPPAARLRAPTGTPSQEAAVVWGELLKARNLMPDGTPAVAPTPSLRRPFPATRALPAFVDARRLASSRLAGDAQPAPAGPLPIVVFGVALAAIAAAVSFAVRRRRRSAA